MLNKIIDKVSRIFSNRELRNKFIFTAAVFAIFRLLAHIPVPAVDIARLEQIIAQSQFLNLLNVFAGGTLSNFSVVAVGINPYITASIIMQLAGMVIPKIKEMQKEGESERAKLNQYTRLLSVPLAIVQSISIITLLQSQSLLKDAAPLTLVAVITSLVAGSMIMMWLGELISEFGIGNGISIILLAGIVSQLPTVLLQTASVVSSQQTTVLLTFAVVFIAVISLIVFVTEAVRKITIQYAKRTRGSRSYGGQSSHLPIKVNVAGVMPIIFAVSIMMVPSFLSRLIISSNNESLVYWGQQLGVWFTTTSPIYMLVYFLVVFCFTYFSALIFFNAGDFSEELKKGGAFIPGIRPGGPTKKFLEYVVTRITFVGAVFLGLIAILPSLAQVFTGVQSLAIGGTSVLIVVSVILETTKQVESSLVGQDYEKYS
ncbi:MAG: preprotein translocase subunit SecY [Patescibacteria group bacterium]